MQGQISCAEIFWTVWPDLHCTPRTGYIADGKVKENRENGVRSSVGMSATGDGRCAAHQDRYRTFESLQQWLCGARNLFNTVQTPGLLADGVFASIRCEGEKDRTCQWK